MRASRRTAAGPTVRKAEVNRNTRETRIAVKLNLDGTGKAVIGTGVPFLDHMLEQVARHAVFDLEVDRKSTRLNSSHMSESRMPSSA